MENQQASVVVPQKEGNTHMLSSVIMPQIACWLSFTSSALDRLPKHWRGEKEKSAILVRNAPKCFEYDGSYKHDNKTNEVSRKYKEPFRFVSIHL